MSEFHNLKIKEEPVDVKIETSDDHPLHCGKIYKLH